ncbi:hypothetical protein SAMN04487989_10656 [Bizionia echini]|uniref:Uncharacterized protein n=1 Tax=Bizionia echini TaxID=649333 RepID=A0A1I5CX11_9FLAO|nr:hypothetical protein [Bizionia echini]SFN91479.1 hypothetical protein SAMN04487989_10656 [Bizionia echini]
MGIGRREFTKLIGLALTGTIIDPLQAVVTHNEYYINKKLGIMFTIPKSWGFVKIKDFGKIKDKQILDGFYESIKNEVYEDLGSPICIVTKYYEDLPEHDGLFSPSIILKITPKSEFDSYGHKNFEELIHMSRKNDNSVLKDYKIVNIYVPYTLNNCQFFEDDSEYLFEHKELKKPIKVEQKSIKFEHQNFYYEFSCHQSLEMNEKADIEFEAFKNSIKLI